MTRGSYYRWARLFAAVVVGGACQPEERPADPAHPTVLVGHWIQMYPATGALDTVRIHEDGGVSGSVAGFDNSAEMPHTYWRIGNRLMPGGFCIGEEKPSLTRPTPQRHCQGYRLAGDTLWLANQNRTAFLRVPEYRSVSALAPWSSPLGEVGSPEAGDSVARPPARLRVR